MYRIPESGIYIEVKEEKTEKRYPDDERRIIFYVYLNY